MLSVPVCLVWVGFILFYFFFHRGMHNHIYCFTLPPLEQRNQASFLLWLQATICKLLVITVYCNLKVPTGVSVQLFFKVLNEHAAGKPLNDSTVKIQM